MITKFSIFLEHASFEDSLIFKGDNEIINKYKNREFKNDDNLIEYVVLGDNFNNKIINIIWHNTQRHSIIDRIKNKTNIKSISEFNDLFFVWVNDMFNNHYIELSNEYTNYNLYLKNRNISIILDIDYDNIKNINTKIHAKTIINGCNSDVEKIIEIDD